jgi:hypothetical protein
VIPPHTADECAEDGCDCGGEAVCDLCHACLCEGYDGDHRRGCSDYV